MYGYFRPRSSHLTEEELKLFNAYYCRVCYCLRILGGQPARFFTTFDIAVYSMIMNMQQKEPRPEYHRCERVARKVMHGFDNDGIGHRLAAMTVILFGEKIRDNRIDGERFKAGAMDLLYRGTVEKACEAEPEMAEIARKGTDRINALQAENADLSVIFGTYGDLVVDLFRCICDLEEPYAELIRRIAEWCFYTDMLYDYDDDIKSGAYNGFRTEGVRTVRSYFDTHYPEMVKMNAQMTVPMREAMYDIEDGSAEARIIGKLVDTALGWTVWRLVSTREERHAMFLASPRFCFVCRVPAKY
jgi:hypothetical protein